MTTDNKLWRVTRAGRDDDGAVELEVRGDDSEHVTTWLLSYGDGWDRVQARTAREAVATWVVLAGFAPTAAEILAPGEPSRAELTARATAAEARVAELTAALREYAPQCYHCSRVRAQMWRVDSQRMRGLCDVCARSYSPCEDTPDAAVLRSLDGVSR